MAFRWKGTDVQNFLWNGTEANRVQRNGVTIWERFDQTVVFSGSSQYRISVPSGRTLVQVGLRLTPDGEVQCVYTTVNTSTGNPSTSVVNIGRWIPDPSIFMGSWYEVRFTQYMQNPGSWMSLGSERTFMHNGTQVQVSATVRRVQEHQDTASWGYRIYT